MPAVLQKNKPEVGEHIGERDVDTIRRMGIIIAVYSNHRAGDVPAIRQQGSLPPEPFGIVPDTLIDLVLAGDAFGSVGD